MRGSESHQHAHHMWLEWWSREQQCHCSWREVSLTCLISTCQSVSVSPFPLLFSLCLEKLQTYLLLLTATVCCLCLAVIENNPYCKVIWKDGHSSSTEVQLLCQWFQNVASTTAAISQSNPPSKYLFKNFFWTPSLPHSRTFPHFMALNMSLSGWSMHNEGNLQKQVWLHQICQGGSLSLESFPPWAAGKLSKTFLLLMQMNPFELNFMYVGV